MRWDRLTPTEIAGLDIALKDGIAGALEKSSGLLIMKTGATGDGGWICAFPPYGLSFVAAKEWARRHQLNCSLDDLYLTHSEVLRAGADLREAPRQPPTDAAQRTLQATFIQQDEAAQQIANYVRVVDSRGSRAWTQAFQTGFRKTSSPIQSDDEAIFIALLEIADQRNPCKPPTDA